MIGVEYREGELFCEGVRLSAIAEEVETPCYVYSRAAIVDRYRRLVSAWPPERRPAIAYAMRVNPSRAILSVLDASEAWVSLTSGMEMMQAFRARFSPGRMIFSGLARSEDEIRMALAKELYLIVADSRSDLDRLSRLAVDARTRARTAIRVHLPGGPPSKVGIPIGQAEEVCRHAADTDGLEVVGLHLYMGHHLSGPEEFTDALTPVLDLVDRLGAAGVMMTVLDLGSAVGALLEDPSFCSSVAAQVGSRPLRLVVEPGRTLVGHAGVLVTRVDNLKESREKRYLVTDASMTDLLTPALFGTEHDIVPVREFEPPDAPLFDVVGPHYETADVLGTGRALAGVVPGDLLCVRDAGAFGRAMSMNLGMRPRPAEVLVDEVRFHVIKRRETFQDIVRTETDVLA
jgi:diaminopimelate decarboxylase